METPITNRDLLFAFGHGIKMTLESLGVPFDADVMLPILQRMEGITKSPQNSLVKGGDDVPDWEQLHRLRAIEKQFCAEYLKEVSVVPEGYTGPDEIDGDEP